MAEIGIAASIIGIAGAAATIAKGLYQIASDIGSAGKQVRLIAQDTNAFSHALTNLGQLLNSGSASTERARAIASDLIVLCKEILADSHTLLKVLEPLIKLTGRKWKRATLRVRWLFEKSKFAVHRQSLEALKATLTLLVATMTYVDAASANVPDAINATLRAQVDSIREEVRLSTRDYEPLLFEIRENVQAIRAEALLEYSKIDNPVFDADANADSADDDHTQQSVANLTPESDARAWSTQIQDVMMKDSDVDNTAEAGRKEDSSFTSDDLAVPVTALSIRTGLPGLPYVQRQAVHFADDVLDMDPSAFAATASTQGPQWQAAKAYQWGIKLVAEGPSSKDSQLTTAEADGSVSNKSVTTKTTSEIERRKRQDQALREAWGKIAYKGFKVGDLVLFLPTRNQVIRPWLAFNIGAPHYFLREQDKHRLSVRDFLLGRITHIEERIVDLSADGSRRGDSKAHAGKKKEGESDNNENPFDLSDGLRWYLLDAEEERHGAPSTPDIGTSTVAAAAVEVMGQAARKSEKRDATNNKSHFDRSILSKFVPTAK
ncbi:oligomeric, coiled-coil, peripheral membrane protein [Cladophialophora chaetospira]|uniref:Autophagy-related protein 11 n=1 Tax=Cladophialophora chaetospira TaxID=386627 RepID=A0AA38X1S3_9EURO|nr:oligomeric, coiled-coil, peripheral membrane protein [Cladophialophora chaetospira]